MTRPARLALLAGGSLAALALLLTLAAGLVVHSGWFREQVRERLVREAERATGGRSNAAPCPSSGCVCAPTSRILCCTAASLPARPRSFAPPPSPPALSCSRQCVHVWISPRSKCVRRRSM